MKTLVDLDAKLLRHAQVLMGARSKRATIARALEEYVRLEEAAGLTDLIGKFRGLALTRAGLQKERRRR